MAQDLETKHLLPLLKVPDYRELIDQDKSIMWNYIDQFRDFMSSQVELDLARCDGCGKVAILQMTDRARHDCARFRTSEWTRYRLWVPRDELSAYFKAAPRDDQG